MTQRRPAGGKGGMRSRNATSPTRQGVAAKELQAARRKKRQREVIFLSFFWCLLLLTP